MKLTWRSIGIAAVVSAAMVGCGQIGFLPIQPAAPQAEPAATPGEQEAVQTDYMAHEAVRGDEDTGGQGAVDVALEWSKKYAKAAEDLLASQKNNKDLREANKRLLSQVARLEMQLQQSQGELEQANEMLVEMGRELREWKHNVLGYRDQMLRAHQVQMQKLKEIIQLLSPGMAQPELTSGATPTVEAKDTPGELSKGPSS